MVDRTSFTINGFTIQTNLTNSTDYITTKAVYEQEHIISLLNVNIRGSGSILESEDPLNLFVQNVDVDYYQMHTGFDILINCSYSDASTSGNITFDNVTVYDSQTRIAQTQESFIHVGGSHNISIINSRFEIYATNQQDYLPIKIEHVTSWVPDDDQTQNVEILFNVFTFEQDSNNRYTGLTISTLSDSIRNLEITLDNNIYLNIEKNTIPLIDIYGNANTTVSSNQMELSNCSLESSIFRFTDTKTVSITSYNFSSITEVTGSFVHIQRSKNVELDQITVIDSVLNNDFESSYFYIESDNDGYVKINNITFANMNIKSRKLIELTSTINFTMISSSFDNITLNENNNLVELGSLGELNIYDCSLSNILPNVDGDNTNLIFDLNSLVLNFSSVMQINTISIASSNIALLNFDTVSGAPDVSKTFMISHFSYTDSQFTSTYNLMTFSGLETTVDFSISLVNITFNNIMFDTSGNLIMLEHQTINPLTINGLFITNIVNGHITLEAVNPQNTNQPTIVNASNVMINESEVGFYSFFMLQQNTRLDIYVGSFTRWYGFEQGSLLTAADINSEWNIYNSSITQNSAIQGGVFLAQNQGVVKAYFCSIFRNFALISGVIKIENNGRFEFYGWTLAGNSAQSSPITEMFDSSETSIIQNCNLFQNIGYAKEAIIALMTSEQGNVLRIFHPTYIAYILSNTEKMDFAPSFFFFQVISSSIELRNITLEAQAKLLSGFIGTVVIQELTAIEAELSGSFIEVTGTNLTFQNSVMSNFTSPFSSSSAIIKSSLDSILSISNSQCNNWGWQFINIQNSIGEITDVTLQTLNIIGNLFVFQSITNISMSNIYISTVTSSDSVYILHVKDTYIEKIDNLTILDISDDAIYITDSTINLIDNMTLDNTK